MFPDERQRSRALRVVVVEDYADAADTLAMVVELWGHDACVARDGPEALVETKAQWPDVVLLDLALPGIDGYEVAKRIREQAATRKTPLLVAVTGYGQEKDLVRSQAEGLDRHYLKPIDCAVLERLLRAHAEQPE